MGLLLRNLANWEPSSHHKIIKTLDYHTGGEPLRVVLSGFPRLQGNTILEKRRWLKEHADHFRKAIMWEPRGHADMYGALLTEPESRDGDFGIVFMHNEGYSTMCGHGIIAAVKAVLETGTMPITEPETVIRIDSPAGRVTAYARVQNRKISAISFRNVPSFVVELDRQVTVDGVGTVRYDLAFGGAYYVFVDADELGVSMHPDNQRQLIELGMRIKNTVMSITTFHHPERNDLNFLYGTIFTGKPHTASADSRNVCIFADGEVDRSPTGTGVSARVAIHYARGDLKLGESMTIESIVGSTFTATPIEEVTFGQYPAIIPEVSGMAYICGKNEWILDSEDEFHYGFFLR